MTIRRVAYRRKEQHEHILVNDLERHQFAVSSSIRSSSFPRPTHSWRNNFKDSEITGRSSVIVWDDMKRQKDSEREAKEYGEKVKLSHSPGFRFEIIGDLARPFFFLAGSFRVSLDGLSERGSTRSLSETLLQNPSIKNNYFFCCRCHSFICVNVFFFYYVVSLEPDFVKDEPCGCNKDPVPQCGCCGKYEFDGKRHSGKLFENNCCCIFFRQTLPQWAVRRLDSFTTTFWNFLLFIVVNFSGNNC